MSNDDEDVLDSVFHGCALAAYLDQAVAEQGWPSSEATRVPGLPLLRRRPGRQERPHPEPLTPPLELYRTIQNRKDSR